jgi:hypothetical protein
MKLNLVNTTIIPFTHKTKSSQFIVIVIMQQFGNTIPAC